MNSLIRFTMLILFSTMWLSCEVIGEVFKTGFYSGIFLIVLIVGGIILAIAWLSRKKH